MLERDENNSGIDADDFMGSFQVPTQTVEGDPREQEMKQPTLAKMPYVGGSTKDHSEIHLMSTRDVQAALGLSYKGTLNWIRRNITPLGGTVRVGRKNMIHRWALNQALKDREWTGKKQPSPRSRQINFQQSLHKGR